MPSPPDPVPQFSGVTQYGEDSQGDIIVYFKHRALQSSGNAAAVYLRNLPTADPHVVNQLWSNSGVVTISAG